MMNTICGTIKDIHENEVQISIARKAACQGCEASKICHSLARPNMDFRLPKPPMQISVGDQVVIALESTSFIKACAYAFLVPLCAILLALFITHFLDMNTTVQAVFAVFAFLLSLILVRKLGKRVDNPRIIEVLHED
jgi:positive regulator of sigma E activity